MRNYRKIRAPVITPKTNMAAQGEGGGKDDIKTHFITREGTYKLMPLSEYSKPTRVPYNGQTNTPVKVSFINVDDGTASDRICFNVGRELYFYYYNGVRKVRMQTVSPAHNLRTFYCRCCKFDYRTLCTMQTF